MKKRKQNGITLIALVITIIVLLILSAITINLTLGERGIFTTAKNSGIQYRISEYKEKVELARIEVASENMGEVTLDKLVNKIYEQNIVPVGSIEEIDEEYVKMTTPEKYIFLITVEAIEYVEDESKIPEKKIKYTVAYDGNGNTGGSTRK